MDLTQITIYIYRNIQSFSQRFGPPIVFDSNSNEIRIIINPDYLIPADENNELKTSLSVLLSRIYKEAILDYDNEFYLNPIHIESTETDILLLTLEEVLVDLSVYMSSSQVNLLIERLIANLDAHIEFLGNLELISVGITEMKDRIVRNSLEYSITDTLPNSLDISREATQVRTNEIAYVLGFSDELRQYLIEGTLALRLSYESNSKDSFAVRFSLDGPEIWFGYKVNSLEHIIIRKDIVIHEYAHILIALNMTLHQPDQDTISIISQGQYTELNMEDENIRNSIIRRSFSYNYLSSILTYLEHPDPAFSEFNQVINGIFYGEDGVSIENRGYLGLLLDLDGNPVRSITYFTEDPALIEPRMSMSITQTHESMAEIIRLTNCSNMQIPPSIEAEFFSGLIQDLISR
ncbi:MAG: hypothetical protein Q9M91_01880 [Candidatus Dojkabacteria bacterium]|nr:hypothetical protein [Candidatus Dojkabacteria bacterium]MDQ7020573.1 hypothetical protein [Candidatus Dojkabacteria bacterium]